MTPEEFVAQLRRACPDSLKSVLLYGSAVTGDHSPKHSDYNTLVVLERIGLSEMNALSKAVMGWVKAGNPPPLLFTAQRLEQSADVFPMEFLDMQASRQVLWGADLLADLPVRPDNLRAQLEHELKTQLLQLERHYLLSGGRPRRIIELLVRSLSGFLSLLKSVLRLYEKNVPTQKLEAARRLARHVTYDVSVFEAIDRLKKGDKGGMPPEALFEKYHTEIEKVVQAVDHLARPLHDDRQSEKEV